MNTLVCMLGFTCALNAEGGAQAINKSPAFRKRYFLPNKPAAMGSAVMEYCTSVVTSSDKATDAAIPAYVRLRAARITFSDSAVTIAIPCGEADLRQTHFSRYVSYWGNRK